jgi:foldase protein PrsA
MTRHLVDHWASVIANGGSAATLRNDAQLTPREHALEFLIVSHWLIGEAAALGLGVGERQIAAAVAAQKRSMPGGSQEFRESLQTTGETEADVRLKVTSSLAAETLRRSLAAYPVRVSSSEAGTYFDSHWRRFAIPERRKVDIAEHMHSRAAAVSLRRTMERTGSRTQLDYHESLTRHDEATESPAVARAIFTAPRSVLLGPVLLPSGYVLFEVTRILPKERRQLPGFREEIIRHLERLRMQARQSRFDQTWEASWRARTSCRPGYVAPQCKEHAGAIARQENPFSAARGAPGATSEDASGF